MGAQKAPIFNAMMRFVPVRHIGKKIVAVKDLIS